MPDKVHAAKSLPTVNWNEWAARILSHHRLTFDEALQILRASDDDLLDLLAAAYRIRRRYFGNTVQLHFLVNAKSGLCPEDCGYCSQSKDSAADVPRYNLTDRKTLLDGARAAVKRRARTYCIVISARGPNEREIRAVEAIVPEIKSRHNLKICVCLGLLSHEQALRLKACGVDRVNHNLNTSRDFYRQICTTHTYQDRLDTIRAVQDAGLEICAGGIVGMGERDEDVVAMVFELRELGADSIPVNFLNPIAGTRLETARHLDPVRCLKTLAMCRFACPSTEIRIAGGRELHLGSLQPLGLYAANSIFVGDYLTTKGQPPEADCRMIENMGFTIACGDPLTPSTGLNDLA
jgi:biotin synthase